MTTRAAAVGFTRSSAGFRLAWKRPRARVLPGTDLLWFICQMHSGVRTALLIITSLAIAAGTSCGGSTGSGSSPGGHSGADAAGDVNQTGGSAGVSGSGGTSGNDASTDAPSDAVVEADSPDDTSVQDASDAEADSPADAAFTPGSLAGLVVWLSSDVGISANASGLVSAWMDQSGQQNDAVQSTASNQPTLLQSGLNGLPVVHFDGIGSHLALPPGMADFTSGLSAFVLVRPVSNTAMHAARFFDFAASYGSLTDAIVFVRFNTGADLLYQTYLGSTPGDYLLASGAVVNGLWQEQEVVAVGGTPGSLVSAALYRNGTSVGGGVVRVPNVITRTSNFIARSNLNQDPYLKGDIAELLIYARDLTDTERQQVEAYLATKWAF
jgi:Concanavalin A-like lectin/glucanases superfamily